MSHCPIQLVLRFRAVDFTDWKDALDEHEYVRVRHGALGHQISRSIDDPHEYLAVVPFASRGGAVGYSQDADRWALKRVVAGGSARPAQRWEESIHELVDAGGYGFAAEEFGRAWSPVYHHLDMGATKRKERL